MRSLRSVLVAVLGAGMLATLLPLVGPATDAAAAVKPRRIVSGWLPYWSTADAVTALTANTDLYSDVNGFWHSATSATAINDLLPADLRAGIVAQAHAAHIPVYGTVVDGTGTGKMAAILRSPSLRAQHVRALVQLVLANSYDGIDLDYEGFAFHDNKSTWAATRPAWVTFVRQLSAALHKHSKKLVVDVPPIYNAKRTDTSGYWVYDWAGIASSVDRLRIMAYDFSVSRVGPIAPMPWVRQILSFAVTQIPAGRIQLGVPAFGRNWVTSPTAGCPVDNAPVTVAPTARQAEALAAQHKSTKVWDSTAQERWFTYRKVYAGHDGSGGAASCTVTRTVWYDDASAVVARTGLVARYHLAGIALWALGYDGAGQFPRLRTYARSVVKRIPGVKVFVGDTTYGRRITVIAHVRSPGGKPVPRMPWRLQFAGAGGSWTTVAKGLTPGSGDVQVSRLATVSGSYRLVVMGTWWYLSATSAPNLAQVHLSVVGRLSASTVKHGHGVLLTGTARPGHRGLLVDRQLRVNGRWTTVSSTTTASNGSFAFRVVPKKAATYSYRVVVHSSGARITGHSARLVLKAT